MIDSAQVDSKVGVCSIHQEKEDPKSLCLTTNDTTIYALASTDLAQTGSVVIDIPRGPEADATLEDGTNPT